MSLFPVLYIIALIIFEELTMNRDSFKDIQPYFGRDFDDAIARLSSKREYIGAFACMMAGNDLSAISSVVSDITSKLGGVHSYDEFQHVITAGYFIPTVVKNTMTNFTVSGGENLDPEKGYLFISNHRDIILDCMLLDYALLLENKPLCEMAVGDNLMVNQFVEDLFRVNGGIIVKRNLPMREKFLASLELSQYFVETVTEEHKSIWVAQKSGRSKDGIDLTHPVIIKMLYLSKRESGVSFADLIRECNIVPVAISYQFDPNDINKGREEIQKEQNDGKYEKKKYEDLISMVKGLRCQKGDVHISIGEPITKECNTPEEVASEIDRQIHLSYKLYDTNYMAYDYLESTDRFSSEYNRLKMDAFLSRFNHLSPDLRSYVLNTYANPVRMMLKEKEREEK